MKKLQVFFFFLAAILIAFVTLTIIFIQKNQKPGEILTPLSQLQEETPQPVASKAASPSAGVKDNQSQAVSQISGKLTAAFLGDSMIDTFVADPTILKGELNKLWPNVEFNILNYGIGSTKADSGFRRLTEGYTYQEKYHPPLFSQNPDIVIVESFSYNHPKELAENRQTLTQIIVTITGNSRSKVLMMATIAPNKTTLAKGVEGINWTQEQRAIEAQRIIDFLKDSVELAKNLGIPIINAYENSLTQQKDGDAASISNDNIHPSEAGKRLLAQLTAQKFQELHLVEGLLNK